MRMASCALVPGIGSDLASGIRHVAQRHCGISREIWAAIMLGRSSPSPGAKSAGRDGAPTLEGSGRRRNGRAIGGW